MNNPHIIRKTTSPTSAPPEAGIHWINTATGEEFFSVGTATVADWVTRASVTSVNGQTGVVTLTKSDVGLSNVDNTSDANKPISTATQTALNAKQNTITGAATSVVSSDLSVSKALVSDGSGKIAASSVSSTTLGYLDATSSVQTQINAKANDADVIKKDGSVAFTADQSMGTHKLTNVVDPFSAQDAATKAYVDNLITGLDWKEAVHAATIANVNLASAPASIDSHTLNPGERVLVKDQSLPAENGIYDWNGAGVAMTRSSDANTWPEIVHAIVFVEQGTTNGGSKWNNTNVAGGTLGVTAITWTIFASASTINGTGTVDYNAYWTGAGTLAGEQYVSASRGGLATDASAFTGVVKSSGGSFSASSLVNSDVSATAAIDHSKMATLTSSKAMVTDASGVATTSTATATEVGYLSGVTSAIQTQISARALKAGDTFTGSVVITGAAPIAGSMLRVTNTGSGDSFVVEDQANPDSSSFKIGNDGRVTIGATTETMSTSKVTVNSSNYSFIELNADSASHQLSIGSATAENRISSVGNLVIYNDAGNYISIEPDSGFYGPAVYCVSSGISNKTGINNSSPTQALDVNGNIVASGTVGGSNLSGTNTGDETNASIKTKLGAASASSDGYLTSSDWSNFNSSYSFIPVLKSTEILRGFIWLGNNSTTLSTENIAAGAATGTVTARSVALTNALTKQVRASYAVSTPAANAQCGYRATQAIFILETGFRFKCSFAVSDSQYNSGARQFYGLTSTTGILGISSTVTVDSLLNIIGIGSDATDTNLQIFHNDGSGVATKIDLGSSFPANRTSGAASTDWFSIEIYNAPGSSSVLYKATSYATNTSQTGTLSSNLPSNATFLAIQSIRTSGSSSNACSFDISQLACYSPS